MRSPPISACELQASSAWQAHGSRCLREGRGVMPRGPMAQPTREGDALTCCLAGMSVWEADV